MSSLTLRPDMHILGIVGSLRRNSYNRMLLNAARQVAPDGIRISLYDIGDIPLYNQDLDGETPPDTVARFKQAITDADGLLIVTPEYNHSIPGVLKNALDWASRPMGNSPLRGKVTAGMGAATGQWGTIRAQQHLRDVLFASGVYLVQNPQVLVARARDNFDESGALVNEQTGKFVVALLEAMQAEYALRHGMSIPQPN